MRDKSDTHSSNPNIQSTLLSLRRSHCSLRNDAHRSKTFINKPKRNSMQNKTSPPNQSRLLAQMPIYNLQKTPESFP